MIFLGFEIKYEAYFGIKKVQPLNMILLAWQNEFVKSYDISVKKPCLPKPSGKMIFNDTHREKNCFTQFSTRMHVWLLLTVFICFRQSIKVYSFHYHVLNTNERLQIFEKCV